MDGMRRRCHDSATGLNQDAGPSWAARPEAKTGEADLAAGEPMQAGMAKPPPPALPRPLARIAHGTRPSAREGQTASRRSATQPPPCRDEGGGSWGNHEVPPRL